MAIACFGGFFVFGCMVMQFWGVLCMVIQCAGLWCSGRTVLWFLGGAAGFFCYLVFVLVSSFSLAELFCVVLFGVGQEVGRFVWAGLWVFVPACGFCLVSLVGLFRCFLLFAFGLFPAGGFSFGFFVSFCVGDGVFLVVFR